MLDTFRFSHFLCPFLDFAELYQVVTSYALLLSLSPVLQGLSSPLNVTQPHSTSTQPHSQLLLSSLILSHLVLFSLIFSYFCRLLFHVIHIACSPLKSLSAQRLI